MFTPRPITMNPTDTSDQHHRHGEQGKGAQGFPYANGSMANGTPLGNGIGSGIGGGGNVSAAAGGAFGSLGGTPTKPAAPLDTGSSLFTYTPFGSTPAKPMAEEEPKRKSIHESWVNVEWNEVKQGAGQVDSTGSGSPVKQPSARPEGGQMRDHPMASVPMAPSEMEREPASRTQHFFGGGMLSEMAAAPSKPEISKPSSLLGMTGSPQKMHDVLNGKPMTPLKQNGEGFTAPPSVPPTISQTSGKQPEPSHLPAFASKPAEPHTPKPMMGGEEKAFAAEKKMTLTPTPAKVETPKSTAAAPAKTETASTGTTPRTARTPRSKPSTPATPRSSGRQRKTVDRLSPAFAERTDTKTIEVPAGSGTKLADIPHGKAFAEVKEDS